MDVLRLLLGLLPPGRSKNRLLSLLPGWRVDPTAHVGPTVLWRVVALDLGPRSRIGVGNVLRELTALSLGEDADIGQWNWISAAARHVPEARDTELRGVLRMAEGSAITSRHYLDVSGGLALGRFSAIGGVRITVLTHSYDVREGGQRLAPVVLGDHTLVFTACVLLPGARLGDRVVVATNSVVGGGLDEGETLYGGSPAKPVASLAGAHWFTREQHRTMSREEEQALLTRLRRTERDELLG